MAKWWIPTPNKKVMDGVRAFARRYGIHERIPRLPPVCRLAVQTEIMEETNEIMRN